MSEALHRQVQAAGLEDTVRFLGPLAPDQLGGPLSAADVFVLATRNEGWANVFLEAMACGLPVVTTRVGGNAEVVSDSALGELVDWWDPDAFRDAVDRALARDWDRERIIAFARSNEWEDRIRRLVDEFRQLTLRQED